MKKSPVVEKPAKQFVSKPVLNLPQWLIDLLEDVYSTGLEIADGGKFKAEFGKDPEGYLISLLLAVREEATMRGPAPLTEGTLREAKRSKFLKDAQEFLEKRKKQLAKN